MTLADYRKRHENYPFIMPDLIRHPGIMNWFPAFVT